MGEQELTGASAQGGAAGTGASAQGGAARSTASKPQTPETPKREDLDSREDFRRWKSNMDRIVNNERFMRTQAEQQLRDMQGQLDQLRLQSADPDEAVAILQQRIAEYEQRDRDRNAAIQAQAEINDRAIKLLAKHKIDVNDPKLDWSGDATEAGYARLVESINAILTNRLDSTTQSAEQETQDAVRQARTEGIQQGAAARVSLGTGAPSPVNPIENITDPDELLKLGLLGEESGARG